MDFKNKKKTTIKVVLRKGRSEKRAEKIFVVRQYRPDRGIPESMEKLISFRLKSNAVHTCTCRLPALFLPISSTVSA